MPLYFAPIESLTDAIFRQTHHACFPGIDKYFIPFLSPTESRAFTPKEWAEIAPEHNDGLHAVPQLLAKDARHFLWAASALADLGYPEVNLNLGCPSGTVTGKGKGSGLLRQPETLRRFLDEIYAHAPLAISIKTRIGFDSEEEWEPLVALLADYPIHELTIHPRTRSQFYKGVPHSEAYAAAFARLKVPLVCNGDLFSPEDCRALKTRYPHLAAAMLARGIVANPALAQELLGGPRLTLSALEQYHQRLCDAYMATGNRVLALVRLREAAYYMARCFENPRKPWKQMRKARTVEEYLEGAKRLFGEHTLLERPYFSVWEPQEPSFCESPACAADRLAD